MVSIYDVEPRKLIEVAAAKLEKMPEMAPPDWADYVKTGVHNMRPPNESNWWYIRSASILRAVYKLGPIGVQKLRTKYGGRKNRGHKPDKTFKASGNILRKILQKLELIGYVKQAEKGVHKGRVITPQGKSFMDKLAVKLKEPYTAPKKEKKVKEKKVVEEKKVETTEEKVKEEKKEEEKPKEEVKETKKDIKVEIKETKEEVKKDKKTEVLREPTTPAPEGKPEVKKDVVKEEKKEEVKKESKEVEKDVKEEKVEEEPKKEPKLEKKEEPKEKAPKKDKK